MFTSHGWTFAGLPKHVVHQWLSHCSTFVSIHGHSRYPKCVPAGQRIHVICCPSLSKISLKNILETSDNCYGHHVHPTWAQSSIYETWWRGWFRYNILLPINIKKSMDNSQDLIIVPCLFRVLLTIHAALHHTWGDPTWY